VERWVAETDFDDEGAVVRLQDRLRSHGVERRLSEMGARRGDEVVIGARAFLFLPEEMEG
jgi:GTP-binding protein